jgi:hypothetical protein
VGRLVEHCAADFTLADYHQTVFITMGAGFTFLIAAAIMLGG